MSLLFVTITLLVAGSHATMSTPQNPYLDFQGEKSLWHDGFDRYDFTMDNETLAITQIKRPESEGFGIGAPTEKQSRCVVICPKQPAPGNPWSWQGCYWDHQPQTEVELLRRGFHIAYVSADTNFKPDRRWDAWYDYLTQKHGLSSKPTFVGMSRGGQYELRWAIAHPERVSAIYADNPGADDDILRNLLVLARNDVPILFVCGTNDPLLGRFALPMEATYQQLGGRVSMMLKDGAGHHPHSLRDPKPIADFLEKGFKEKPGPPPDYVEGMQFVRSSYYDAGSRYTRYPEDGYFITTRGAAFTECYDQYGISAGFDAPVTVIAPKKEAPGRPWVLRSSHVGRNEPVDQALLAKGFHIVVGPVGYNADGPNLAEWNKLYAHLTQYGFAKKVTLEGEGGGAGSVYGWAVENPGKVACIYAKNPIMSAPGFEKQPLDHLDTLANSGVPVLHVCDDVNADLAAENREVEQRYRALNGKITVLHITGPAIASIVDFILQHP